MQCFTTARIRSVPKDYEHHGLQDVADVVQTFETNDLLMCLAEGLLMLAIDLGSSLVKRQTVQV